MALSGTVLDGRYKVGSILGSGAMGEVYRGEQLSLKRPVAIKVLRLDTAPQPNVLQRFEREAQVLSRLSHPAIASVIDFGQAEGVPYLVMELVDGRSLEELLAEGAAMPPSEAAPILIQLCEALEHAHGQGVLHRDLKPSNILVAGQRTRLLDFGIARLLSEDAASFGGNLTASGMVLGTPRYASPEQAMGLPLDFRSDLYSLGAVAYRMLSGQTPFDAETPAAILTMHATAKPVPLLKASGLPSSGAPLCAIIDRLLEKQPQDRFPSAASVADALKTWLGAPATTAGNGAEAPLESTGSIGVSVPTENLAIVFSEIEGWTEKLGKLSYDRQAQLVALHDAIALPVISALGGKRVKSIQETQLYRFPSPTRAIHAAMAMIDRFAEFNQRAPEELRLMLRVGIATGEVRVEEGDVFGEPVNVAARVKALAAFGEIVLNQAVYLAMNKSEAPTEPVGQRTLKGIPEPVMIHRVVRSSEGPLPYAGTVLRQLGLAEVRAEDAAALAKGGAAAVAQRLKSGIHRRSLPSWPYFAGILVVAIAIAIFRNLPAGGPPEVALPPLAVETRAMIADGRAAAAIEKLEAEVEAKKDDAELHAALAHAYVHGGRKADAVPHFAWAAKKVPQGFDQAYVRDLLVLAGLKGQNGKKASDALVALGPGALPRLEQILEAEQDETIKQRAEEARGRISAH